MRPGDLLRQLDRRLLPPLARGMARLGHGPLRLRMLTTVALCCSAAVLVTAVWAADRRPAVDQTVGEVTRVGVVQGQSIPGYVEASRVELRALLAAPPADRPAQPYALVTMSAYLAPDRLPPILAEVSVSEVFTRVWRPGTQTQIVRIPAIRIPDDVLAGMAEVARRKDQEARDYQRRSAEVTGSTERDRELRRWYDSGARVAADEATAYRSRCSCVYAAVVRGEPAALARIAARPEVRAVDPAPEVRRLDRTVFSPPLPEQHDIVRPPADTDLPPAPTGGPSGTPGSYAPEPSGTASSAPAPTSGTSDGGTPDPAPSPPPGTPGTPGTGTGTSAPPNPHPGDGGPSGGAAADDAAVGRAPDGTPPASQSPTRTAAGDDPPGEP